MIYTEVAFHLLLKTSLVIVSFVLSLVFLRIPLPSTEKLKAYRLSLKVLAGAYAMIAAVFLLSMLIDVYTGLFSFIIIITASIQTLLFALTLIILYNPKYVTKKFVFLNTFPLIGFIVLFIPFLMYWGNPYLRTFDDFYQYIAHPTVVLRLLLLIFYAFELIYFSLLFLKQERIYKQKLDTYFADNLPLQSSWVKYYFFIALVLGVLVLISCFHSTIISLIVFSGLYTLFFIVFGIRFIQYKRIYMIVEPALSYVPSEKIIINSNHYQWGEMKEKIITEKYYLKENVNIEEMARFLRVGRTKLSNSINQEENMHFNLWINTLRINDAKSLFKKHEEFTILQVSEMVGYSEQSNFSTQFKKITGKSPSLWRKEDLYN